jgi:hypothetical protein
VHESIYQQFSSELLRRTSALKAGDPLKEDTDLGPVIDNGAADRIGEWIDEAKAAGARIIAGGTRDGRLWQPTIIEAAPAKVRVNCQEVFAPVLTLQRYEDVKEAIAAANRIVTKPYKYGGGHAKVEDTGYDCSGTVSYALIKAGLLKPFPLDSSGFMGWGEAAKGKWITVYAHGGHAYVVIAGLRLDTGYRDAYVKKWGGAPGSGPRWGKPRNPKGFTARHPLGL